MQRLLAVVHGVPGALLAGNQEVMLASLERQAQELVSLLATAGAVAGRAPSPPGMPAPATPYDTGVLPTGNYDHSTQPHPWDNALSPEDMER